ncbi:MAG: hypothetical protein WDN00_17825 [Limisphaerales bacterium]
MSYFRVPSDPNRFDEGDARTLPRHSWRANFSFFDGHVETMRNSQVGYTLARTDSSAMWARDHDQP